jgi:hypothetical protein
MNEDFIVGDIKDDINEAFDQVMTAQALLLTPRQQAWVAFRAGAEWAMKQMKEQLLKKPLENPT